MSETSHIVCCPCGVSVRLPENAKRQILRCPQCKRGLPLSADSTLIPSSVWEESEKQVTCPICQSPIEAGEEVVTCPDCKRVHHTECWAEVGGCGMYGCRQAFPAEKTADPSTLAATQNSVWEDQKATCPVCREIISRAVSACPMCKTPLHFNNGRMVASFHGSGDEKKFRQTTVTLFVMSFIPCLAPLTLLITGIRCRAKRKQLAQAGQIYQTITYLGIGISSLFCVLMFVFLLFGR